MVLDVRTRWTLEQIIDGIVRGIPSFAKLLFDPQVKEQMHVQNQNDFSLGFALGMIQNEFWTHFYKVYGRLAYQDEILEVSDIIYRRSADIRNAIFNAGWIESTVKIYVRFFSECLHIVSIHNT